ncbi:MAG: aminopeptidase P family protein [Candidatus Aenigmarchaeota archaeon]|nr:aminopeptidase P family protein [Candidatus Aenigmarchaeota archaeon]
MKKEADARLGNLEYLTNSKKLDGVIFFNHDHLPNPNFTYMTDISELGLFLFYKNDPQVFTVGWKNKYKSSVRSKHLQSLQELPKIKGKIGIDFNNIQANMLKRLKRLTGVKFVDISTEMENVRKIKSSNEINIIKDACKLAGKAYNNFSKFMDEHNSEIVLKYKIETEFAKLGLYPSFPTIVATKENIMEPHHIAGDKIVEKPILVDFGIKYKNYSTDNTRTIGSKYEKLITEILLDLEIMLKPGAKCADIDKFVRKKMGKLQKSFITALGHGIGIAVHELPVISSFSKDCLEENMVIAIEPGIYLKNGIRVENMYLITKDGCENLTSF